VSKYKYKEKETKEVKRNKLKERKRRNKETRKEKEENRKAKKSVTLSGTGKILHPVHGAADVVVCRQGSFTASLLCIR
jgi:septal ring factor EnvC (AmiA/AmiB activator)